MTDGVDSVDGVDAAQPGPPPGRSGHRLVHLSDLHLTASGVDEDGVDAARSLACVLDTLRHVEAVDAVVVSGDLADDGSVAGARAARAAVGGWATARGAACVFTTGNHDRRDAFGEVFGSGHLDRSGADVGKPGPAGTCTAVSEVAGLRLISLDSLVPGQTAGALGDGQLAWLAEVLARPAPAGTVVTFHHPPVWVPGHPMREVVLREPERLAAVLRGSDVRAVLTGHLHQQLAATLAGVPVWVTPGVVTRIDTAAPAEQVRGVLGGGATLVDLGPPGVEVFRVVPAHDPRAGEAVYRYDARSGADLPDPPELTDPPDPAR